MSQYRQRCSNGQGRRRWRILKSGARSTCWRPAMAGPHRALPARPALIQPPSTNPSAFRPTANRAGPPPKAARALEACQSNLDDFAQLTLGRPTGAGRTIPIIGLAKAGAGGFFDEKGFPTAPDGTVRFPGLRDVRVYAVEITVTAWSRCFATTIWSSCNRALRCAKATGWVFASMPTKPWPKCSAGARNKPLSACRSIRAIGCAYCPPPTFTGWRGSCGRACRRALPFSLACEGAC